MRQFKLTALHAVAVIILAMATFTACKKDAFSEKDALAAQTTLLQTKFSYDLAIKAMDLQIQRTADSAKIVLQNLVNSGASALEILKQTNLLAQIAQNQTNLLTLTRYQDSLNRNLANLDDALKRAHEKFTDSVTNAKTNATLLAQIAKQYTVTVIDATTSQPVAGATVSVIPVGASAVVTATSDANGSARFATTLIVDPASYFAISAPNMQSGLVRENAFLTATAGAQTVTVGGYTIPVTVKNALVSLYNPTNTRNTIRGSVLSDLDLTNGDAVEGVAGHLLTFTTTVGTVFYQFATLTDAAGNYSVKVPDATYAVVTPGTLKMQQKMFVNAWQDEDASSSLPRIDETGTVFSLSTGINIGTIGSGTGYYYKFPNDVNGKVVFAAMGNSFSNANNTQTTTTPLPYNYANFTTPQTPFVNRAIGGNRTDSINGTFQPNIFNLMFNNSNSFQSSDGAVRYRSRAGTNAQPLDTVPVTFVSLVPGWITTAPQIVAVISPSNNNTGRVQNMWLAKTDNSAFVQTVAFGGVAVGPTNSPAGALGVNYVANASYGTKATAGGIFNQAVMFTQTGRSIFTNLSGVIPTGFYPTGSFTNTTSGISVTGSNTVYVGFEYRNVVSKDRLPR